ncbi:MAG: hypothetical protein RR322_00915, partial [Oscillospiraceae bacterium]
PTDHFETMVLLEKGQLYNFPSVVWFLPVQPANVDITIAQLSSKDNSFFAFIIFSPCFLDYVFFYICWNNGIAI